MFNKEANTVREGFNVTEERSEEIFKKYGFDGKQLHDIIDVITSTDELTQEEKYMTLFEIAANWGQIVLMNQAQETAALQSHIPAELM